MKDLKITCDACGRNLTETGNCVAYKLTLQAESVPSAPGVVTLMIAYPPIKRQHDFCNLRCLDQWAMKRIECVRETTPAYAAPPVEGVIA